MRADRKLRVGDRVERDHVGGVRRDEDRDSGCRMAKIDRRDRVVESREHSSGHGLRCQLAHAFRRTLAQLGQRHGILLVAGPANVERAVDGDRRRAVEPRQPLDSVVVHRDSFRDDRERGHDVAARVITWP